MYLQFPQHFVPTMSSKVLACWRESPVCKEAYLNPDHIMQKGGELVQQYKCKTYGFCTFSCFRPHIWNSLPQDLRHYSTSSSFKAKLTTFLFSQYFHPILYLYPISASVVFVCMRVLCVHACVCVPILIPYVTECIVCVQGHDTLTFSFLSSFLFFYWAAVLWS